MITVVGIGPGNSRFLTIEGQLKIEKADIVYGHKRQIEAISHIENSGTLIEYEKIDRLEAMLLDETFKNKDISIVVLASGEPSLYGIGKYVDKIFKDNLDVKVELVPGISSVQYLFAKAKIPMNDVYITSSHGKDIDIDILQGMEKIAFMTDAGRGPAYIAKVYQYIGMDPYIVIGENLSYEDEKITICKASELDKTRQYSMCVVLIIKGELYE